MTLKLENARLTGTCAALRPVEASDARAVYPLLVGCNAIFDWILWDGPASLEELEGRYGEWRREGALGYDYMFAITARERAAMLGCISLRLSETPHAGDVGYYVLPHAQRRGLATDALRLLAHLGFEHLRVPLLTAEVMLGNEPSCRALERVGFTRASDAPRTRALSAVPTKADRCMWTFTLAPSGFRSANPGWTPVDERVLAAQQ